ncbi:hypothetical protein E0I61_07410 [Flavobacterium ranwuense]|uniref:Uncharacterized protein n=2 Tax=Flavobacteriaceae TaxID=49546 RepID=A0ABY2DSM4_9FLAO|nr:hypothetical protein E0I61_07410 [Flavobacterium ranwuense]TDE54451.1 hypothetical protein E0H99_05375 [Flavobacterium sp. GT3P67]
MLVKPILPVLEYVVNYEYISKVLCINKDKPKMQCNGKCHLMKELAKASDAEKPLSSNKKGTSQILDVLIFEEIKSFVITPVCFGNKEKINSYYSNLYFHLNSASVFHPPPFIS